MKKWIIIVAAVWISVGVGLVAFVVNSYVTEYREQARQDEAQATYDKAFRDHMLKWNAAQWAEYEKSGKAPNFVMDIGAEERRYHEENGGSSSLTFDWRPSSKWDS